MTDGAAALAHPHCGEYACAADGLDLLLCLPAEEARLHDHRLLRQHALAQNLEVARPGDVDDGGLLGVLLVLLARLLRDERPEAVEVDGRAVLRRHVGVHVEVPHANLSEVTWVVLVEVDPVVVLPAGVAAAARVLAVLPDAAVAVRPM